eukprot:5819278-Pyramimonas_sp.AAC.1
MCCHVAAALGEPAERGARGAEGGAEEAVRPECGDRREAGAAGARSPPVPAAQAAANARAGARRGGGRAHAGKIPKIVTSSICHIFGECSTEEYDITFI